MPRVLDQRESRPRPATKVVVWTHHGQMTWRTEASVPLAVYILGPPSQRAMLERRSIGANRTSTVDVSRGMVGLREGEDAHHASLGRREYVPASATTYVPS